MSVKIKLIIGFIIIFLMVSIQSFIIFTTNQKQQQLSAHSSELYKLNSVIRDKLINIKTMEADLTTVVEKNFVIPTEDYINPRSAGRIIWQFYQWNKAFVRSKEFYSMEDSRKNKIFNLMAPVRKIRLLMDRMRIIKLQEKRRDILYNQIKPAIENIQVNIDSFSQMSSWVHSAANNKMVQYTKKINRIQILIMASALVLIIFIIFYSQYILRPINWLMDGVYNITHGNLDFEIPIHTNDELGKLAKQFNVMNREIRNHREHLEELVDQRTKELEESNNHLIKVNNELIEARKIMDLDMRMAINVQKRFFLESVPENKHWDISFVFKPASGVSGDMYDFYTDDKGKIIGTALMDVSGHGIASGLVTMIAKAICFRYFHDGYEDKKLRTIVDEINDELIRQLNNVDNYLTGIMLKFDYERDCIEYVNAGHPEMLYKMADSKKTIMVKPKDSKIDYKGNLLGIELARASNIMLTFTMNKGDVLLLYTDCLNECFNQNNEQFGLDRIQSTLNDLPDNMTADEIVQHLHRTLVDFSGKDEMEDDLTMIVIKRK